MLELGGLELEESLGGRGGGEAEGIEVAAGVAALVGVELCGTGEEVLTGSARGVGSVGRRPSIVEILLRLDATTFVKNCVVKGEPAGGAGRYRGFGHAPAERLISAKPMASTSIHTRVVTGTLMSKPR